jgi:hypothetical protein
MIKKIKIIDIANEIKLMGAWPTIIAKGIR